MFKNVSELSPDLISLLEQKIRYFEVCSFSAFEKSKKVPVALLDERVKKQVGLHEFTSWKNETLKQVSSCNEYGKIPG